MPPSMGGHAAVPGSSSGSTSKVVQSPQYMASSGLVGASPGADLVQSPAYNPASPQYAPATVSGQATTSAEAVAAATSNNRSSSKFQPTNHATIKEEVNEHSD